MAPLRRLVFKAARRNMAMVGSPEPPLAWPTRPRISKPDKRPYFHRSNNQRLPL